MEAPATPPPAPAYTPPPGPVTVERPGMVTAAGIVMIVVGALVVLIGLLFLVGGAMFGGLATDLADTQGGGFGTFAGAAAGVAIAFAAIFLAIGILDIVAGAQVLGGKTWARITGIVLAAILALFGLTSLGNSDSLVFGIIWLVANAFIIFALVTGGRWFAARSAAS